MKYALNYVGGWVIVGSVLTLFVFLVYPHNSFGTFCRITSLVFFPATTLFMVWECYRKYKREKTG